MQLDHTNSNARPNTAMLYHVKTKIPQSHRVRNHKKAVRTSGMWICLLTNNSLISLAVMRSSNAMAVCSIAEVLHHQVTFLLP